MLLFWLGILKFYLVIVAMVIITIPAAFKIMPYVAEKLHITVR